VRLIIHGIVPGPQLISQHAEHLLGTDRKLLDRQHPLGDPECADDRPLGESS